MQDPSVRLGLVGCGRIARMFHLPILHALPGASLVAVADPDPTARSLAADQAPGALAVADVEDLLERSAIDAVIVCAPTPAHADVAVTAFGAGCDVYVEKPLAAELADAQRIHAAWEASGRLGAIGFNFRFHPQVQEARRLVRDGRLGRIRAVRTVFSSPPRDLPAWKLSRGTGGGAMLDLASHHLDLVRGLLAEEIAEVVATAVSVGHEQDTVQLQLRTISGIPVQITATQAAAQSDHVELLGDLATVRIDRMARRRLRLDPARAPQTPPERVRTAAHIVEEGVRATIDGLRPPSEPSFARCLEAFVADVRRTRGTTTSDIVDRVGSCGPAPGRHPGPPPRPTGASIEDGYRVAQVLDAAERSLVTGAVTAA